MAKEESRPHYSVRLIAKTCPMDDDEPSVACQNTRVGWIMFMWRKKGRVPAIQAEALAMLPHVLTKSQRGQSLSRGGGML